MNKPLPRAMIDATRLTRAGRLGEATALLQRLLRGALQWGEPENGDVASTTGKLAAPVVDVVAEKVSDADTVAGNSAPTAAAGASNEAEPRSAGGAHGRFPVGRSGPAMLGARRHSPVSPSDVAPAAGRFVTRSFSNKSGNRSYKLYMPSRHEGEPRPLIVMLHGCTQSADDFAAGTRMNFVAEEHACFVAYPEQAVAANASKCWNWFSRGHQMRGQGEPELIAGITRQIVADYDIDPRRVYIAGLSAGGAAAAIVAEAYPDLYVAVGVHSGLACGVASDLQSALAAMRGHTAAHVSKRGAEDTELGPMPTIVFHGDRDATVHPRNGADVIARAGASGDLKSSLEQGRVIGGHRYTRAVHRDASERGILEEWVVHGSGHAWSGGNRVGTFTDPRGPDASREMLRFFLEHAR